MSIRTKMILFISAIMLVSVTLISAIWYRDTTKLMDRYLNQTAGDLMKNAYHAFDYILTDTDYMLSMIALNEENIIAPLKVINEESKKSEKQITYEQLQNKRLIDDYIGSMYGYKYYITGVSVISASGNEFKIGRTQQENVDMKSLLSQIEEEKRRQIHMLSPIQSDSTRGTSGGEYVVPAARCIEDSKGKILGYAIMYFDYSVINSMFSDNLPENSKFQVVDNHKNIVYSNDNMEQNTFLEEEANYVYSTYYASKVGWEFLMAIPSDAILLEINQTVKSTGALFVFVYLLLVVFGIFFVYTITWKIKTLSNAMNRVANGELTVQSGLVGKDEISQMGKTFDHMVSRIRELLDKITLEEKKKREVEMDFLQAQINPHFISNTLNVIVWMAKAYHANNIVQITKSLITLLRAVMRRGDNFVTIEEELAHVKSYINIIEYSGNYDLTVTYNVAEDVKTYKTLRFILQPIVENAIQHGISENLEEEGCIHISVEQRKQNLYIEIEDNGCGMSQEQIKQVLTGEVKQTNTLNRIGIKNVNERLKLFFGEDYGTTYLSEEGKYTKVSICLPII